MKHRRHNALLFAAMALTSAPAAASAAGADSTAVAAQAAAPAGGGSRAASDAGAGKLTYLVPELEGAGYRVTGGSERFAHRVGFSPAVGRLGANDLFSFRFGYSPNTWLGYEVALGHNPADGLHALLHTFNVVLRYPFSGRVQPYGTLGYGMMTVYPGQAINADPVSKNTLTYGGGLELYLRDDVSLRGELRGASVLGQELHSEGTVAYEYREYTIGLAFYRGLGN
jgi:opacity protein-like surface antigen